MRHLLSHRSRFSTAITVLAFALCGCPLMQNANVTVTGLKYTIGGNASGIRANSSLVGDLVLQNNGGDNLTVSANGSFVFPTSLVEGSRYNVTILSPGILECLNVHL